MRRQLILMRAPNLEEFEPDLRGTDLAAATLGQNRARRVVGKAETRILPFVVNDSELKADKGELLIAGKQRGYQLHVTERRHGAQFRANLLPEKFSQLFAQSVHREAFSRGEEELHDRLGGDLPHPSSLWSNLAHGKKKRLRIQPEVSHERAQPLGIDVRVTRGCCDTLMAQERLDIAQVGSALVEQEGGGRMAQRMSGNNRHPRTLAGELEACVEGLVAKGRAVPAWKDERRSREFKLPSPPSCLLIGG